MAAERPGAQTSPGTTGPVSAADEQPLAAANPDPEAQDKKGPAPEAAAKADLDEVKRKFREALERKRSAHASANAEGAQDTGKVHGSHGPAASRRSFRRKSGG
jgi:Family of unknown function (DUF5302)